MWKPSSKLLTKRELTCALAFVCHTFWTEWISRTLWDKKYGEDSLPWCADRLGHWRERTLFVSSWMTICTIGVWGTSTTSWLENVSVCVEKHGRLFTFWCFHSLVVLICSWSVTGNYMESHHRPVSRILRTGVRISDCVSQENANFRPILGAQTRFLMKGCMIAVWNNLSIRGPLMHRLPVYGLVISYNNLGK